MPFFGSFQACLTAAVQLKSAVIKTKPGRQDWEQAPPFLRCTAAAVDSVKRARASGFSVQFSTAIQLKEQGNELISKDPAAALERYTQALSVFLWFDRGPDHTSEDVPLVCSADKLVGAEKDQAYHLLTVCFSNVAACLVQMGLVADAAYACSKALKYDPYNVKALYRRAMAHRQADTTAGLEAALSDLAAANQLEPSNNQVRLALVAVQHELREHRRQERAMYGNMFQRAHLYGDCSAMPNSSSAEAESLPPAATAGSDGGKLMRVRRRAGNPDNAAGSAVAGGSVGSAIEARDWRGDAAASDAEDWREGNPAGSNELDPEDLLSLDPQIRKTESAMASREADLIVRKMQAALACTRNRKMAERLDAERARRVGRFPWWAVPWWAYALIGLHLAYRLIKVWRIPAPSGGPARGGVQEADSWQQAGRVEL